MGNNSAHTFCFIYNFFRIGSEINLYKQRKKMNEKKEVKSVDLKQQFSANGKNYRVTDKICIDRWTEYEKLEPRLTYGIDFESIQKSLNKLYSALNDKKFADAAVLTHNLMNGIKDALDETRVHPALLMCSLVINYEGEDTTVFNKQIQLQKIEDWQKEGLDILSFFAFALKSINGFRETYLIYIQTQAEEILKKNPLKK